MPLISPSYSIENLPDKVVVTITPPSWSGYPSSKVILTPDQAERFKRWRFSSSSYIQDALPDLSPSIREQLLSGITPEDWDKSFKEEEE